MAESSQPDDLAPLRATFPGWEIEARWTVAGTGPDSRYLRASRGGVTVSAWLARSGGGRNLPRLRSWHRRGLAMMRVPAVRPGAVHRPGPELAALVYLAADRADDGNLRKILRLRRLAHATR